MSRFVSGLVLGVILVPLVLYVYMLSGSAPVAATEEPLPLEKLFANTARNAKIRREMPTAVPIVPDDAAQMAGALIYRDNCAVCHGLLGQRTPVIASAMFPRAPQLLEPKDMVNEDAPGETYWKAKNGIRLSGMPAFGNSLSSEQLWQVSLLLASADRLPPQVIQALTLNTSCAQPNLGGTTMIRP